MDYPPDELKYNKISKVEETYQWDGQLYRKVAEKKLNKIKLSLIYQAEL